MDAWTDELHRPVEEPHYRGGTITLCATCETSWPCDVSQIMTLEAALRHFARPTHGGNWRCPLCSQVVTAGFAHRDGCAVGDALRVSTSDQALDVAASILHTANQDVSAD